MGVIDGDRERLLSMARSCGMGIPQNGALEISENLHLIMGYLLKDEREDLEFNSYGSIGNMRVEG